MKKFFILICITAFYYGCKKDEVENTVPEVTVPVIHKIKEVTFSDGRKEKYSYNNSDRVDSISYDTNAITTLSYFGSTIKMNYYSGNLLDSIIFFLNAIGYPDSAYAYDLQTGQISPRYYTFNSNGYITSYKNNPNTSDGFYYTYQNGNLIKTIEVQGDTTETDYSYDTAIINNTNFELYPKIFFGSLFVKPSKNLVKSYSVTTPFYQETFTVQNWFNSDGYLTTNKIINDITQEAIYRYYGY